MNAKREGRTKQAYSTPKLTVYGDIDALTQAGGGHGGHGGLGGGGVTGANGHGHGHGHLKS
jgi:hypothetical protein